MPDTRPTVVVAESLAPVAAQWLGDHAHVVGPLSGDSGQLLRHLPEADGLIVRTYTQVDASLLDQAPRLRVVGRAGVGLDNIDLPLCRDRGIPVVYTPDANTQAVVEYVFGLILDQLRPRTNLPGPIAPEAFHELRKTEVGGQLDQMTLGIVGFGRIGKRLGCVAHTLGINLLVTDLLGEVELRKAVDYPFDYVSHDRLYQESDIVTIHVDGRAENRHMLNAEALAQLRSDTLLINAARGMLVDNKALAAWAQVNGQAHVILDVHDPEPLPDDYPLYGLPNVRLLPHLASRTHRALENMSWVIRDVVRVLEGNAAQYPAPTV
jgi:phosphoglycerate dehydrogenase-like enzyme